MSELLGDSLFFGVAVSVLAYQVGMLVKKKWKLAVFNPLLISIILVIAVLLIFHVDYETYNEGAKYLSYLLTPATVCLAIPLYEQLEQLKKNVKAIVAGILSGVVTSLCSVLILALAFGLSHEEYVTLLPKSITTAIGMGVLGGAGGNCDNHCGSDYRHRCSWKYHCGAGLQNLPDPRAGGAGNRNRKRLPCHRNRPRAGNGRGGRSDEQPFHSGFRAADSDRNFRVCNVSVTEYLTAPRRSFLRTPGAPLLFHYL